MIWILVIWNIVVFLIYGYDKRCAINNRRRISENNLILYSALFGSIGAFTGMSFFRHKTLKWKFKITIPLLVIIHLIILSYYYINSSAI